MTTNKPTRRPASRLRLRRLRNGWSQKQIGEATGIPASALSNYEAGSRRDFTEAKEIELANFYGLTLAALRREAGFRIRTKEILVPRAAEPREGAA